MPRPPSKLKARIAKRIAKGAPFGVWTPSDFLDLGDRDGVDKALQRLARAGEIRRIERGLYDKPRTNSLTGAPTAPDYRQVIEALTRRDQTRMLVDGLTAANDLGFTNAVPARVVVHTDTRRRSIRIGNLTIQFKKTMPSRLYWAGRPAMRVVQALHWLKDMLPTDRERIVNRLRMLLGDPTHGPAIREDLHEGFPALPTWMQGLLRELLQYGADDDHHHDDHHSNSRPRRGRSSSQHGVHEAHSNDEDRPNPSTAAHTDFGRDQHSGRDRRRRSKREKGA